MRRVNVNNPKTKTMKEANISVKSNMFRIYLTSFRASTDVFASTLNGNYFK